jgi:hypothetical protein
MSRTAVFPESPAHARRIVRWTLEGESGDVVEVAELLVSELLTNAIVHGGDHASLVVDVTAGHVHVEVLDLGAAVGLEPLNVGPFSVHGRGLTIVDALASSWGVSARLVGKAVWFDLDLRDSGGVPCPARSEHGQRDERENSEGDGADEDRAEGAEVLRGDTDCDDRDGQSHVAEHEIRGDHLSSALGWGEAIGGREAAHEHAADRDPSDAGTGQEEAE